MRPIPFATVLILAAGFASPANAQGLAPISRTDTRVERSDSTASPRTLDFQGEFASMRDELENYPVGVNLATPGAMALPTSTTGPDGFDWGMNTLRGQGTGEFVRVVDLSGSPVGGNATRALRIRTFVAQFPGSFYTGANLRWEASLAPTPDHNARLSSEMYISTIAELYSFEPLGDLNGFVAGRLIWGGTCVDGSSTCASLGLPSGPIPTIHTLTDAGFLFSPVFFPARYCTTVSGAPIPGCTPPVGLAAGAPVSPPIATWARWAVELSPDARLTFFLDLLDGQDEFAITSHPSINLSLNRLAWNSSYESQDAFLLVDNIEASGPLFIPTKAPPLDCPYLDDIEWLNTGLVRGQTARWSAFDSSMLTVVEDGAPQGKVLSQTNVFPDNRHRPEFSTLLPNSIATLGNDLVVSFDARFTGNAVRAFSLRNTSGLVARVFRGNEDRSVPGAPVFTPSLFVQTDGAFNPVDSPTGNPDTVQPVVGVHIQDTGFVIPPSTYATITMRISANGALRVYVDGQRVYAGPSAFRSAIASLAFESENNAAAEGAELRVDNVAMSCDAPSCATDFDFDDLTSFSDLNAVLSNFGATGLTGFHPGDANADGVVNFTDLNAVLAAFGTSCQ